MTKYCIVWNEAKTEGYITPSSAVAYEARKGSESNCYDEHGTPYKLAQAFCDIFSEENCTIENIDLDELH